MDDQPTDSPAANRATVAPASADLRGQLRLLLDIYHRARRRAKVRWFWLTRAQQFGLGGCPFEPAESCDILLR
jgi:hypothetical protein